MAYEIEKGVPMPLHVGKGATKYPFNEMVAGDSFVGSKAARSAAHMHMKRGGGKFTTRDLGDGNYRIWRVA